MGGIMSRLAIGLTLLVLTLSGAAKAQEELVVSSYGGEWTENQKKLVIEPFEKEYGVTVRLVTGYSAEIMAQLQAQKDNPQMDVVYFSGGQEAQAAADGLLAPIKPEELSNYADMYPIAVAGIEKGEGPAHGVAAIGLLYNHDLVQPAPTSWMDLWDPRFAGKVVVTDLSNSYGLLGFLMINKVRGGTLDNIQPGLDAVGKLLADNDEVVTGSPEVRQLFAQGIVEIGAYAQDHAYRLREAGAPIAFVMPKEGAAASFLTINLVANRPNRELAVKFIDFNLRPEVMAGWAEAARYSPTNSKTKLSPDVAKDVIYGEDAIKQLVAFDPLEIGKKKSQWLDQWNRLLAR
jgi:putative spermidine/putrescine transport system substrate-binding protein